jgi:hypothetical protein
VKRRAASGSNRTGTQHSLPQTNRQQDHNWNTAQA